MLDLLITFATYAGFLALGVLGLSAVAFWWLVISVYRERD